MWLTVTGTAGGGVNLLEVRKPVSSSLETRNLASCLGEDKVTRFIAATRDHHALSSFQPLARGEVGAPWGLSGRRGGGLLPESPTGWEEGRAWGGQCWEGRAKAGKCPPRHRPRSAMLRGSPPCPCGSPGSPPSSPAVRARPHPISLTASVSFPAKQRAASRGFRDTLQASLRTAPGRVGSATEHCWPLEGQGSADQGSGQGGCPGPAGLQKPASLPACTQAPSAR